MPVRAEVQRRAEYLGRAMKMGLTPLWAFIGVAITLIGGSVTLAALWGVKHLIWVPIIVLLVLFAVLAEGSYRMARNRETEHGKRLAELEGEREAKAAELEDARAELEDARRVAIAAPAAVNPAEWDARCNESGEFPASKALVFGLWHRFNNPAARLAFSDLRCTVTDPDQITTTATGTASYYQYIPYFFSGCAACTSGALPVQVAGSEVKRRVGGHHQRRA